MTAVESGDIDAHIFHLEEKHCGGDSPTTPREKACLGKLLLAQGKPGEALPFLQGAMSDARVLHAASREGQFLWAGFLCDIGAVLANTLDYGNDFVGAEKIYNELLSIQPNGVYLSDYAIFLHRKKKDYAQAEAFYKRALELFPSHSSTHLKYATFLRHVKKDFKRADVHYRLAIEANKKNPEAIGSYASFLHGVLGKIDIAGELYEEAVKQDSFHANNLCNFGLFLSEEKGEYARAETLYKRVLSHTPRHANTLYNFAVMLDTHCSRKDEAEVLYRKVVDDVEPKHAFALYNLAVLLEEKVTRLERDEDRALAKNATAAGSIGSTDNAESTRDESSTATRQARRQEVCSLYRRAVECDDKDAVTTADFGRYLLTRMEDPDAAEPMLFKSLQLDANNVVAIYNLALLMHKHKANLSAAESLLATLINPSNAAGHPHLAAMQQLARIHLDKFKASADQRDFEACLRSYEKTMDVLKDPALCMIEYLRTVTQHGSNRQKTRGITYVEGRLSQPGATGRESDIRSMVTSIKRLQDQVLTKAKGTT